MLLLTALGKGRRVTGQSPCPHCRSSERALTRHRQSCGTTEVLTSARRIASSASARETSRSSDRSMAGVSRSSCGGDAVRQPCQEGAPNQQLRLNARGGGTCGEPWQCLWTAGRACSLASAGAPGSCSAAASPWLLPFSARLFGGRATRRLCHKIFVSAPWQRVMAELLRSVFDETCGCVWLECSRAEN